MHAAHASRAFRRFQETAAVSRQFGQLASAAPGGFHAFHPRRHRQPEGMGKEVLCVGPAHTPPLLSAGAAQLMLRSPERKVDERDRRPELERAHAHTQNLWANHHIGICTTRGMKKDVLCLEPCPDHVRFTQTTDISAQTTTQLISCGEAQ